MRKSDIIKAVIAGNFLTLVIMYGVFFAFGLLIAAFGL